MIADTLFVCLEYLKTLLERLEATEVHFAIIDPERRYVISLIFIPA